MAGALIFGQEHGSVDRINAMSSGAEFYRWEHAHKSIVVLSFWWQEHCFVPVRQEHCFVVRNIVLATGAWFRRQEPCYVDRGI